MTLAVKSLSLLLAGAFAASAMEEPSVQFGRRGELARFGNICRSEALELPGAFVVAEFIIENGGRTCFTEGRSILFVPERAGQCATPLSARMGKVSRIPWQEAEDEVLRCSAFGRPSAFLPTGVAIYRPSGTGKDADFTQFGIDAAALTAYDMLPVTHFGAAFGLVCLEAPDARLAVERIRDADIADPADLLVEIDIGTCRDLTRAYTGTQWPEVVTD